MSIEPGKPSRPEPAEEGRQVEEEGLVRAKPKGILKNFGCVGLVLHCAA